MGRMPDVSTQGSIVWDPQTSYERARDFVYPPPPDSHALPRFADLTNDIDREMKAITRKPGTYHLICNPDSFQDEEDDPGGSGGDGGGGNYVISATPMAEVDPPILKAEELDIHSDMAWDSVLNLLSPPNPDDPEIVILRKFEEPTQVRRNSMPVNTPKTGEPSEFSQPNGCSANPVEKCPLRVIDWMHCIDDSDLVAGNLEYHRRFIAPKLLRMHDARLHPKSTTTFPGGLDLDPFESESVKFPPLFHAILAVSVMSSCHRKGYFTLDALQHYKQALPTLQIGLKNTIDLCADGTMFTHFLLLLYQILAAEQWYECMWEEHLTQLRHIMSARSDAFGKESFPYFLWCLVIIDTYAVLSAGGTGKLINWLSEQGFMPDPKHIVESLVLTESPDIVDLFQEVLELAQKVVVQAVKLGQLSNKMRDPTPDPTKVYGEGECCRMVYQLKDMWQAEQPKVHGMINSAVLTGAYAAASAGGSRVVLVIQETYQHACALYNTVVIFGFTSVFPNQRTALTNEKVEEILSSITAIVNQAATLASGEDPSHILTVNHRYMLFPLFLAGIESREMHIKQWVADTFAEFEKTSVGRNVEVVNQTLLEVYDRQQVGGPTVDWMEYMAEKLGRRLFIYDI